MPNEIVNIDGLEKKWYCDARGDDRPCAACGKPLNRDARGRLFEELDDEDSGENPVPLILFKQVRGVTYELDLHARCARPRMTK